MLAGSEGSPVEVADRDLKESVREYWDAHVHDWKIATHPPGAREFFLEVESYRFEKLEYLPRRVRFDGYPGKKVLDVGCGLGNDLSRFARGGSIVTGVDISPRAIELARTNFDQRGLAGTFQVMDGEALELPDESFDLVYCHTVLHFTPHPDRMIREIHRVLRRDGLAILMTVNRKSWMNWLRHVMKVDIDHVDSPVFRHMTLAEFGGLLAPFAVIDLVPERFPVPTKVHSGIKAALFNKLFVAGFNALPQAWTRKSGHHLLAFCRKETRR